MTVGSRARTMMTMRADVERNATVATDNDGHPQAPSWAALATIPCRVYSKKRREIVDGSKIVIIQDLYCAVPLDADIEEADRIATVEDRLGNTLFQGPFTIETKVDKVSFSELKLQAKQSGSS